MKMFTVKPGQKVQVCKVEEALAFGILNAQKQDHICVNENHFFLEDMAVDPLNRRNRFNGSAYFSRHGYYAFRKSGWLMLVHQSYVEVG